MEKSLRLFRWSTTAWICPNTGLMVTACFRPDRCRLLVVEGSLGGGYDMGLANAIRLAEALAEKYNFPMELMVVGKISADHKAAVQARFTCSHPLGRPGAS